MNARILKLTLAACALFISTATAATPNIVLIMVDDERLPLEPGEEPMQKSVRFRTLGCYPLTGAVESDATTLPDIIQEMLVATRSEREGRVIDTDQDGSMEQKKKEGYF